MRVLITTDTVGGVWRYTINLIKCLEQQKADIILATMGPLPSESQLNEVRRLKYVSIYSAPYKLEWMDNPWKDLEKTQRWLLDLSFTILPDIIHFNSFAFDCNVFPAPVVMVGHSCVLSWWEAVKNEPIPDNWKRYANIVRNGLQTANVVIAPSHFMMNRLIYHYGPFKYSSVIYNSIEKEDYAPAKKEKIVFCMGRIWDEAKNVALLLKAAKLFPYPVYVAGDTKNKLDICTLPTNLTLLGQLNKTEIAKYLSKAAVFALPARYEPFGLSALEAAFSGCALILGDTPSQREIWEGSALYCAPSDVEGLAGKIIHLMNDNDYREQQSKLALAHADKYKFPGEMSLYYYLYKKIIEDVKSAKKQKATIY